MSAAALRTNALAPPMRLRRLRRAPGLLIAVALGHALLLALLVQSAVEVARLDDHAGRWGAESGSRLEVALLEPTAAPVAAADPTPVALTLEHEAQPEAPQIEFPTEEQSEEARLTGLYVGQLRARVERTWELLRPHGFEGVPRCTVRLTPGLAGAIREVTLQQCAVDETTRALLLRSIRAAAPLPSPPAGMPERASIEFPLGGRP